jgi:hypothetical protein
VPTENSGISILIRFNESVIKNRVDAIVELAFDCPENSIGKPLYCFRTKFDGFDSMKNVPTDSDKAKPVNVTVTEWLKGAVASMCEAATNDGRLATDT